jgi:hypothetical protein
MPSSHLRPSPQSGDEQKSRPEAGGFRATCAARAGTAELFRSGARSGRGCRRSRTCGGGSGARGGRSGAGRRNGGGSGSGFRRSGRSGSGRRLFLLAAGGKGDFFISGFLLGMGTRFRNIVLRPRAASDRVERLEPFPAQPNIIGSRIFFIGADPDTGTSVRGPGWWPERRAPPFSAIRSGFRAAARAAPARCRNSRGSARCRGAP